MDREYLEGAGHANVFEAVLETRGAQHHYRPPCPRPELHHCVLRQR